MTRAGERDGGAAHPLHTGVLGAIFRTPGARPKSGIAKRAHELLDYVGIGKLAN
jgi:branched-chain amino acid transport system ATP-binding protein